MIRNGHNPVVLADHPLVRAWFDESQATIRAVLVRQRVWQRSATLLGHAQERPTLSVLPELSFRGSLWAELQSISHPVTLCTSKRELDPTPCLAIASVSLDNPFTYLDKGGRFHRDNVAEQEVVLRRARRLHTARRARRPAGHLAAVGALLRRPEDLDLSGSGAGSRGPDLQARVEHPNQSRYVFNVHGSRGDYVAVVRPPTSRAFTWPAAARSGGRDRPVAPTPAARAAAVRLGRRRRPWRRWRPRRSRRRRRQRQRRHRVRGGPVRCGAAEEDHLQRRRRRGGRRLGRIRRFRRLWWQRSGGVDPRRRRWQHHRRRSWLRRRPPGKPGREWLGRIARAGGRSRTRHRPARSLKLRTLPACHRPGTRVADLTVGAVKPGVTLRAYARYSSFASMRRFCWRPSSVSLGAMGCSSPKPTASSRFLSMGATRCSCGTLARAFPTASCWPWRSPRCRCGPRSRRARPSWGP